MKPLNPVFERTLPHGKFRYGLQHSLAVSICLLGIFLALWPPTINAQELGQGPALCIEAEQWKDAEKLFRSDPHWLGGDGASSVDLGGNRVLWLFGDSFVNTGCSKSRRDAAIVRNTIAIQEGYDPTKAVIRFYWNTHGPKPGSFFREEGKTWFWPGSAIMLKDRLLIFLMWIKPAKNDLGFEPCGWKAVLVTDPAKEPPSWRIRHVKSPQVKEDVIVGSGSALIIGDYLYAYSACWKDNSVYLVRWPHRSAQNGDLLRIQWWAGPSSGWVEQTSKDLRPVPVFSDGQMEFTVHYEPRLKRFLQVQTLSFKDPCLSVRSSQTLVGPWSVPACVYSPPERATPSMLIYAGKSHPALQGAEMVFTYALNSTNEHMLLDDKSIYFPIVLKAWIMYDHTP